MTEKEIAMALHWRTVAAGLWRRGVRARVRTLSGADVVGCFWGAEPRGDFLQLQRTHSDGVFTVGWMGVTSIEEFRPPRVDRRLRTAPHGDALDTSVRPDPLAELRMAIKVGRLRHLVDDAAIHADELAALHFAPHAAQRRFMDNPRGILGVDPVVVLNSEPGGLFRHLWAEPTQFVKMEWVDDPLRPRRPTDWGPTFWGGENAAPGRLTPGTLKLYGARLMARGGDVAQAMADQIDFEWESRRWAEPPGDAEASANGMGC